MTADTILPRLHKVQMGNPAVCRCFLKSGVCADGEGSVSVELSLSKVKTCKLSSLCCHSCPPWKRCEATHTLNVEMLGWKCVVACRSAVIPWLLWHLSVSFFFSFFHSFFPSCRSCLVLSSLLFTVLFPLFYALLFSLDTCHYPVLNRLFSPQNVSTRLTVTACVFMCVTEETECVSSFTGACVRGCVCVCPVVSAVLSVEKSCVSQWRLQSNFSHTRSAG